MKKHLLAVTLLAACASSCAINLGTTPESSSGTKPATTTEKPKDSTTAEKPKDPAESTKPAAPTEKKEAPTTKADTEPSDTKSTGGSSDQFTTEEVQFPSGKNSINFTRTIKADGTIEFTFRATKGQRLTVSATTDAGESTDLDLFLTEPGANDVSETAVANEPLEFTIKKSGSHSVSILNRAKRKITFDFGLFIQ